MRNNKTFKNLVEVKENDKEDEKTRNYVKSLVESEIRKDEVIVPPKEDTLVIPFSDWLKKNRLDKQFGKFMDVFKKLHINIPFPDVLGKMSSYVKFMKDILANKRKPSDYECLHC